MCAGLHTFLEGQGRPACACAWNGGKPWLAAAGATIVAWPANGSDGTSAAPGRGIQVNTQAACLQPTHLRRGQRPVSGGRRPKLRPAELLAVGRGLEPQLRSLVHLHGAGGSAGDQAARTAWAGNSNLHSCSQTSQQRATAANSDHQAPRVQQQHALCCAVLCCAKGSRTFFSNANSFGQPRICWGTTSRWAAWQRKQYGLPTCRPRQRRQAKLGMRGARVRGIGGRQGGTGGLAGAGSAAMTTEAAAEGGMQLRRLGRACTRRPCSCPRNDRGAAPSPLP